MSVCGFEWGVRERSEKEREREEAYERSERARSGNIHTAGRDTKYSSQN